MATVLLPQPDSPTMPTISPGFTLEVDVADGGEHAVAGVVLDLQVVDIE